MLNPLVKIKMKQIDKLAWIEIKDKKNSTRSFGKNTIPGGKEKQI
jgi:hypothetical protein